MSSRPATPSARRRAISANRRSSISRARRTNRPPGVKGERVLSEYGLEQVVRLARAQQLGIPGEDLPDGLGVTEHHQGRPRGNPERERSAVAPVALLEKRDRAEAHVQELHQGRQAW